MALHNGHRRGDSAAMLALAILFAGAPLAAAGAASPAERLASPCQGCHGQDGANGQGMPPLRNTRGVAEFAALLRDFRAGSQPGTVMGRIARGYTDDEIAVLARFYGKPD